MKHGERSDPEKVRLVAEVNAVWRQLEEEEDSRRRLGEELEELQLAVVEEQRARSVAAEREAAALRELHNVRDERARLQQGLQGYLAANAGYQVPIVLGELARACAGSGRLAEAKVHIREALAASERTGERSAEPELRRIEGDILLASGQGTAHGERCFVEALATAKRQGAVWWQLRAAVSLARLWASGGDRQRAVDLLSPVYASFTEGFDTPDLRDARALLDALQ